MLSICREQPDLVLASKNEAWMRQVSTLSPEELQPLHQAIQFAVLHETILCEVKGADLPQHNLDWMLKLAVYSGCPDRILNMFQIKPSNHLDLDFLDKSSICVSFDGSVQLGKYILELRDGICSLKSLLQCFSSSLFWQDQIKELKIKIGSSRHCDEAMTAFQEMLVNSKATSVTILAGTTKRIIQPCQALATAMQGRSAPIPKLEVRDLQLVDSTLLAPLLTSEFGAKEIDIKLHLAPSLLALRPVSSSGCLTRLNIAFSGASLEFMKSFFHLIYHLPHLIYLEASISPLEFSQNEQVDITDELQQLLREDKKLEHIQLNIPKKFVFDSAVYEMFRQNRTIRKFYVRNKAASGGNLLADVLATSNRTLEGVWAYDEDEKMEPEKIDERSCLACYSKLEYYVKLNQLGRKRVAVLDLPKGEFIAMLMKPQERPPMYPEGKRGRKIIKEVEEATGIDKSNYGNGYGRDFDGVVEVKTICCLNGYGSEFDGVVEVETTCCLYGLLSENPSYWSAEN